MLSSADAGEMRRNIQSNDIRFDRGPEALRRIGGRFKTAVDNIEWVTLSADAKHVYALFFGFANLYKGSLYRGGHHKQYVDAQLGIIQRMLKDAEGNRSPAEPGKVLVDREKLREIQEAVIELGHAKGDTTRYDKLLGWLAALLKEAPCKEETNED